MTSEKIASLVSELKRYDNKAGYRLSHEEMDEKLKDTVGGLLEAGDDALDGLHALILNDETWSCHYALEIIRKLRSERSIPFLIRYLLENDNSDHYGGCEEAMYALSELRHPAVEPLIEAVESAFKREEFYLYLVGALTRIVDDRVYNFMRYTLEDCIAKPDRYIGWFDLIPFMFDLDKQGKKETTLPLLRALRDMDPMDDFTRNEIEDTIMVIEDPEGYEKMLEKSREEMKPLLEELQAAMDAEERLEPRRAAKVGRNEPCPCGSGKKFKKCCLNKDS